MTEIQNSKPDSVALNVLKFCNYDRRVHRRLARPKSKVLVIEYCNLIFIWDLVLVIWDFKFWCRMQWMYTLELFCLCDNPVYPTLLCTSEFFSCQRAITSSTARVTRKYHGNQLIDFIKTIFSRAVRPRSGWEPASWGRRVASSRAYRTPITP